MVSWNELAKVLPAGREPWCWSLQSWGSQGRSDAELLELAQQRNAKMIKKQLLSYKKSWVSWVCSALRRDSWRDLISVLIWRGRCQKDGSRLCFVVPRNWTRGNGHKQMNKSSTWTWGRVSLLCRSKDVAVVSLTGDIQKTSGSNPVVCALRWPSLIRGLDRMDSL